MLTTDSPQFCKNYSVCSSYQKSYAAGSNECAGCMGDLTPHRLLSRMIDAIIDPLADAVHHNTAETMFRRYVDAIQLLARQCNEKNLEVTVTEASLLLQHRCFQTIRNLKDTLRIKGL